MDALDLSQLHSAKWKVIGAKYLVLTQKVIITQSPMHKSCKYIVKTKI